MDAASAATLVTRGRPAEGEGVAGPRTVLVDLGRVDLSEEPSRLRAPRPVATTPAVIAFTSGTTGRPRGIVHSHWNLLLPGCRTAVTQASRALLDRLLPGLDTPLSRK